MARIEVFSIFVVAVAVSVAYGGLIPNIPIPSLKENAVKSLERGTSMGKKGINIRISAFIAASNADDSLTPLCKQCIAQKANDIRADVISEVETTGAALQTELQEASDAWLGVWLEIVADLPNMILGILTDCQDSLENAKSDCIDQTATSA